MDHTWIDDHDLVEHYLRDRLSADERIRFEDHFVDCPRCLDQLELAREFRGALRDAVAAEMVRHTLVAGLAARLPRWRPALALLAIFAVALPAVWLAVRGGPGNGPGAVLAPQVNIPVYDLGAVRAERGVFPPRSPQGEDEVLEVSAARWLTLEVPGEGAAFPEYRLTVRDASGETVWRSGSAEPDRRGALRITLPPDYLSPGGYRLELEGLDAEGTATRLASHAFHLTP